MKKNRVILLAPPTSTKRNPEENLGLEYLVSESKLNGYCVKYIDAWMENLSGDQVIKKIKKYNPEFLGISPSMDSIQNSIEIIEKLRINNYSGHIVMGGIYASFEAKDIVLRLKDKIDGVLTGEGDETFQLFLKNKSIFKIPGSVYFYKDKIIKEPRNIKKTVNLNRLPIPSHETLSLVRKYKTPSHVMGSKGCYGNCSFCSVACFQKFSSEKKWRGRTPKSIVDELDFLVSKGEDMVKFIDDNFFGPTNQKIREQKIANLIISRGIKIKFRFSLRVNDVDEHNIKLFKKAGLFAVSLGVESFIQRKLNDYSKGTTVKQNLIALKILRDNNIYVQMGHIMFDPFTTISEIKRELFFLEKNKFAITKGICTELFAAEGTKITERIKSESKISGKNGTNYQYKILNPESRKFFMALKIWSNNNSELYNKTIDPISSPKNIPLIAYRQFHKECISLKEMDIYVAKKLLNSNLTKLNQNQINKTVTGLISVLKPNLDKIQNKINFLYNKYNLT